MLFFQLLCTFYFAALAGTLYLVRSAPLSAHRAVLLWMGAATALVFGLHFALGAPLGLTTNPATAVPRDKFFFLLQFDGLMALKQVVYPWWRRSIAPGSPYQRLPAGAAEKLAAANEFFVSKAIYVMLYAFQGLALWVPKLV